MLISELPPEIRALAEKNRTADTLQPGNQSDFIHAAFEWAATEEGIEFREKYTPPPTKAGLIAFHKAELAKLEAGQ